MTKTRRVIVTVDGKTKVHERQVWPFVENPRKFVTRIYGKGHKLVISTEKDRIGEFCRPYTIHT